MLKKKTTTALAACNEVVHCKCSDGAPYIFAAPRRHGQGRALAATCRACLEERMLASVPCSCMGASGGSELMTAPYAVLGKHAGFCLQGGVERRAHSIALSGPRVASNRDRGDGDCTVAARVLARADCPDCATPEQTLPGLLCQPPFPNPHNSAWWAHNLTRAEGT